MASRNSTPFAARRLAVAALLGAAVLAAPARAEFVIGVAGPMTGAFADVGAAIEVGVRAAAGEIGRIADEPIVIEVVDDKCDGEIGAAVANRLVGRGARLVVGHACTAAALPAARVYAENGVVLISPAATNPRFTDERVGPGVFRLAPRSDAAAGVIAEALLSGAAERRIGFAHDGSAFGQGLADQVREIVEARGGRSALSTAFTPGERSQNALAGAVQDAGLTDLVIGAQQADAAVIAGEIRARGLTVRLLGGDPLGLEEFVDLAGPAAEGAVFVLPVEWSARRGAEADAAAIRAAGGRPTSTAILSAAALRLYAAAAGEVGAGFSAVTDRLHGGDLPFLAGRVAFDDKGDADLVFHALYRWQGRTPVPLE